jgi:hypothetical protein
VKYVVSIDIQLILFNYHSFIRIIVICTCIDGPRDHTAPPPAALPTTQASAPVPITRSNVVHKCQLKPCASPPHAPTPVPPSAPDIEDGRHDEVTLTDDTKPSLLEQSMVSQPPLGQSIASLPIPSTVPCDRNGTQQCLLEALMAMRSLSSLTSIAPSTQPLPIFLPSPPRVEPVEPTGAESPPKVIQTHSATVNATTVQVNEPPCGANDVMVDSIDDTINKLVTSIIHESNPPLSSKVPESSAASTSLPKAAWFRKRHTEADAEEGAKMGCHTRNDDTTT